MADSAAVTRFALAEKTAASSQWPMAATCHRLPAGGAARRSQ
jgi:hypothetical protein